MWNTGHGQADVERRKFNRRNQNYARSELAQCEYQRSQTAQGIQDVNYREDGVTMPLNFHAWGYLKVISTRTTSTSTIQ